MNLVTWFKGLGVFVLSSCITALATMTLDPASFNFSKAGLAKLGAASLIFGIKAVLLYLKQSPLPNTRQGGIASWTKVSGALALCVVLTASSLLSGCVNSWEQTTYASLAASKALIDCAVAGYNHSTTIFVRRARLIRKMRHSIHKCFICRRHPIRRRQWRKRGRHR